MVNDYLKEANLWYARANPELRQASEEENPTGPRDMTTKPKYWVQTTVDFCPVCCREDVYRKRMPLPKPENRDERYIYEEHYDWCNS